MKFLITGGAGSVGHALTSSLLEKGHSVRILDKKVDLLQSLGHKSLELIKGEIEDLSVVNGAVEGIDVIVHLAWSFSDDPIELLASDLKGHLLLLDAAIAEKISNFFTPVPLLSMANPSNLLSPKKIHVWWKKQESLFMELPN